MGRIERKDGILAFVLFTPKLTKVKNLNQIEKYIVEALFFPLVNT